MTEGTLACTYICTYVCSQNLFLLDLSMYVRIVSDFLITSDVIKILCKAYVRIFLMRPMNSFNRWMAVVNFSPVILPPFHRVTLCPRLFCPQTNVSITFICLSSSIPAVSPHTTHYSRLACWGFICHYSIHFEAMKLNGHRYSEALPHSIHVKVVVHVFL